MLTTIVFIDSPFSGYEALIGGLPEVTRWCLLNGSSDGLKQIAGVLAERSGLASIQIVPHGSVGALHLGSAKLDGDMWAYRGILQEIGATLAPGGDLLLLGCEVVQGDAGQLFIEELSRMTCADVAASTETTGLGGNWRLEANAGGANETPVAISEATQQSYAGALAVLYQTTQPAAFNEDGASSFPFAVRRRPARRRIGPSCRTIAPTNSTSPPSARPR